MPTISKMVLMTARLVLVLVVFATIARAAEHVGPLLPAGRSTSSVVSRPPVFTVKGHRKGFYPGRSRPMRVTIRNPNPFPLAVRRIFANATSVRPACPSRSITIKTWRGRVRVPTRGHRRIKLAVRMRPRTPDACQGVRFRLRFGGTAVRA